MNTSKDISLSKEPKVSPALRRWGWRVGDKVQFGVDEAVFCSSEFCECLKSIFRRHTFRPFDQDDIKRSRELFVRPFVGREHSRGGRPFAVANGHLEQSIAVHRKTMSIILPFEYRRWGLRRATVRRASAEGGCRRADDASPDCVSRRVPRVVLGVVDDFARSEPSNVVASLHGKGKACGGWLSPGHGAAWETKDEERRDDGVV